MIKITHNNTVYEVIAFEERDYDDDSFTYRYILNDTIDETFLSFTSCLIPEREYYLSWSQYDGHALIDSMSDGVKRVCDIEIMPDFLPDPSNTFLERTFLERTFVQTHKNFISATHKIQKLELELENARKDLELYQSTKQFIEDCKNTEFSK